MGVPPVANDTLDSFLFQQMGDPGIVVSGIQSHVLRQLSQPRLNLVENFGERGDVVHIGGLDVDVDDHVALAVYRPVFAVMESVRLAFSLCWPLSGSLVLCIRLVVPPPM